MRKESKGTRISCDVGNCRYHDGISKCTADCVNVGPCYACSSSETICATFKPGK